MKEINSFELIEVPEGIEASVKARAVTVKGARGTLTKVIILIWKFKSGQNINIKRRDVLPTIRWLSLKGNCSLILFPQEFKHLAVDIYMTDAKTIKVMIK